MKALGVLFVLGLAAPCAGAGVEMANGNLNPVVQVGQSVPFILGRANRWLCWASSTSGVLSDIDCDVVGTATTLGASSTVRCGVELSAVGSYPIEWNNAARVVINVRQCKVQAGNLKKNDGGALTISVTQGAATVESLTTPSVLVTFGPTTLNFVTRGLDATHAAFYKFVPAGANCGDVSGTGDAIEGGHGELNPDGTTLVTCCPSTKAGTHAVTLTQAVAHSAAKVCQSSTASGAYVALSGGADTVSIMVQTLCDTSGMAATAYWGTTVSECPGTSPSVCVAYEKRNYDGGFGATCDGFCAVYNLVCSVAQHDSNNGCASSGTLQCDDAGSPATSDHICTCIEASTAAPTAAPTTAPTTAPSTAPTTAAPTDECSWSGCPSGQEGFQCAHAAGPASGCWQPPCPSGTIACTPSFAPSTAPTLAPNGTGAPSSAPSSAPSGAPTAAPSSAPSGVPTTAVPTSAPSRVPSSEPSGNPTAAPTRQPTVVGATHAPSGTPTAAPTRQPTAVGATHAPSDTPTAATAFTLAPTGVDAQTGGGDSESGGSPAALIAGLVSAAVFGCCMLLAIVGIVVVVVAVSSTRRGSRGSLAKQAGGIELKARDASDAEELPSYADAGSEGLPTYLEARERPMFGASGMEIGTINEEDSEAGVDDLADSHRGRARSSTLNPLRPRSVSFALADVVDSVRRFSARTANRARSSMAHLQQLQREGSVVAKAEEADFGGNARFSTAARATRLEVVLPRGWARVIDKGGLVWYQNSCVTHHRGAHLLFLRPRASRVYAFEHWFNPPVSPLVFDP